MSNSLWPHALYSPWNSPGQNTGVGSLSLLQGIFKTQGSNPGLPQCRRILYSLSHKENSRILECIAYPFSRESSQPRNQTRFSCIAGRFFTNWAIREAQHTLFKREPNNHLDFPGDLDDKESTCSVGDLGSIRGLGRFLGRRKWQPTPVFLPGKSPWMEEPGRLKSMGSQRVRHDWATKHNNNHLTHTHKSWPKWEIWFVHVQIALY